MGLGLPAKTVDVEFAPPGPITADVGLSLAFEEMVTVGSRAIGAEAQKAVPVDIITSDQIASSGYAETSQVIQALAPSFNFPRPTITTARTRPARHSARSWPRPVARYCERQGAASERARHLT